MNHKTTKDRVKEIMDDKGISVAQLSRATDIPSARIYKWFKDGLQPKSADEKVLKKWIEEIEEVPHETPEKKDIDKDLRNLTDSTVKLSNSNELLAVSNERNSRNIERLISLLEYKFGAAEPPTQPGNGIIPVEGKKKSAR